MKTVLVRDFIRHFARRRAQPCQVSDRGRVLGTWLPTDKEPAKVDFAARVRKDFDRKLPFTGAALLKKSNAR